MNVSEETLTTTTCKNCGATFEGKFCPNCAQRSDTHRFTLKHFFHESLHAVTHTDKGMLLLIKEMFLRPGYVAREFVAGKRKTYFNPITFLLITTALTIFLGKSTHFYDEFITSAQHLVEKLENSRPDKKAEKVQRFEQFRLQTSKILENSKLITMLVMPIAALLTWLFFRRSGYNYAENLVFNVLIQGELSVYFILFCIPIFLLFRPIVVLLFYLYILWAIIYNIIAYKQFYQQRTWITLLKGTAVQILYYVVTQQVTNAFVMYA